jgi:probable rRNA maturation factor
MKPAHIGAEVVVSNRQRRLKVNTGLLTEIAQHALELAHAADSQLSIVLVNDDTIAQFNAHYHAAQGPTDILSFDYGEGWGELIISVEHAMTQAKRFHSTPACELVLYVVHGILHLHGYDDLIPRDRRRMRAAERRFLTRLHRRFDLASLVH